MSAPSIALVYDGIQRHAYMTDFSFSKTSTKNWVAIESTL
jgi:hypothetical protein